MQKARLALPAGTLPYRYGPLLHADSIRLLVLHAIPGEDDDVFCTIQPARLNDPDLEYEAVSYTWGDPADPRKIRFKGSTRTLSVTRNCHNALRRLRYQHDDRLLWIDAICINQEDLIERSRQVRIMHRIFSQAVNVAVYLGEHDAGSRILFRELVSVDEVLTINGKEPILKRSLPDSRVYDELDIFYSRRWFERVWVIQEVAAKPHITLTCGCSTVSLEALMGLHFGYLKSHQQGKVRLPVPFELTFDRREVFQTPQFSLWHWLYETRTCLATDPKDKVFGLISLINPGRTALIELVNYSQTLEDCFVQIARSFLPVIGLRLLTAVRHPHDKNMPSWVPDWSQSLPLLSEFFLTDNIQNLDEPLLPEIKPLKYDGSTSICDNYHPRYQSSPVLQISGCHYATIIERSCAFVFDGTRDSNNALEKLKLLFCPDDTEEAWWDHLRDVKSFSTDLGEKIVVGK